VSMAAGLTVRAAVFVLAKATLDAAVPASDTAYGVGTATWTDAGMVKDTRRVLPATVVMAVAAVVTVLTPAEGLRLTVTLAARMVPVGKPDPVTEMLVTPGSPAVGEVVGVRVTATGTIWDLASCALAKSISAISGLAEERNVMRTPFRVAPISCAKGRAPPPRP
jgi:hypothetical protein